MIYDIFYLFLLLRIKVIIILEKSRLLFGKCNKTFFLNNFYKLFYNVLTNLVALMYFFLVKMKNCIMFHLYNRQRNKTNIHILHLAVVWINITMV